MPTCFCQLGLVTGSVADIVCVLVLREHLQRQGMLARVRQCDRDQPRHEVVQTHDRQGVAVHPQPVLTVDGRRLPAMALLTEGSLVDGHARGEHPVLHPETLDLNFTGIDEQGGMKRPHSVLTGATGDQSIVH
jgi:hypothetical protein